MLTVVVALLGCVDAPEIRLEGPTEVVVDHLGEVNGPTAVLSDGQVPEGISWTVSEARVAQIDQGLSLIHI